MTLSASLLQHTRKHTLVRVIFLILYPYAWEEKEENRGEHRCDDPFLKWDLICCTDKHGEYVLPAPFQRSMRRQCESAQSSDEKKLTWEITRVEITILRVYLYFVTLFPTRFQRRISLLVFLVFLFLFLSPNASSVKFGKFIDYWKLRGFCVNDG